MLNRCFRCLAGLVIALGAAPSQAQVPAGPEFEVDDSSLFGHLSVAAGPLSDFTVAWTSPGTDDVDAMARRYGFKGEPVGPAFPTSLLTGAQFAPAVAFDGRSRFVLTWLHYMDSNHEDPGIKARHFDPLGRPMGAEFRIDSGFTTRTFSGPSAVSMAPDGRFVLVWPTYRSPPGQMGVAARLCNPRECLGHEFDVNAFTTGSSDQPDVAMHADGSFVVVWSVSRASGDMDVVARLFDATGGARGAEFQVNTYTTGLQGTRGPRVAATRDGSFVVAWNSLPSYGTENGVFARRYDASGSPIGGEFRVNTAGTPADLGDVASDETGNFVVAWHTLCGYGQGCSDVRAQRFAASGARRGSEYRVDEDSPNEVLSVSLASDPAGNSIVAWTTGSRLLLGRRYGGLRPLALGIDAAGNGVLEPGENVDVRPSWLNVGDSAVVLEGTLTELGGPPGAAYTITDAGGGYGTLPSGTPSTCSDCYRVSISEPAVRPAPHWDAAAVEALLPDALGVQKRWPLHVGHSFGDVPPSSPYYRFVETMLHRGVSTGCAPDAYCPAAATSREQMAVFALLGKEGVGYLPPRCGAVPHFSDVPPSSPFCPWVEELARRGVAGGCGDSQYCPGAPVTREQMAAFVVRTLDPSLTPPPCGATTLYADVPATSPFCPWIEELTRRGVAGGCGGGNYCPTTPVTREQMAAFVGGAFGLTLYGP